MGKDQDANTTRPIWRDILPRRSLHELYRFKQGLCYLLLKKHKTRKECAKLVPRFLRAMAELRQSGLAQLVTLGDTLHSWREEIARMWRFTRSNGITEGFHNKIEDQQAGIRLPQFRKLPPTRAGGVCSTILGIGVAPVVGVEPRRAGSMVGSRRLELRTSTVSR